MVLPCRSKCDVTAATASRRHISSSGSSQGGCVFTRKWAHQQARQVRCACVCGVYLWGGCCLVAPMCCYVGCQQVVCSPMPGMWLRVKHAVGLSVKPPVKHTGAVQSPWSRSIWTLGLAAPCSCCGLCCWFAVYRLGVRGTGCGRPCRVAKVWIHRRICRRRGAVGVVGTG